MRYFSFGLIFSLFFTLQAPKTQEVPLFVSPQRVIIEPDARSATVSLTNKSSTRKKYKVLLVDQAMNETGTTEIVDTFAYSAKRMLRYVPGEVILAPGQRQVVRILVRRPKTLEDGDYHTHLLLEEEQLNETEQQAKTSEGTFGIEFATQYGVAIPIVVQKGELKNGIELKAAKIVTNDKDQKFLQITAEHKGNSESFGYLTATYNGTENLTQPRYVRIYREAKTITMNIPWTKSAYKTPPTADINVMFKVGPSVTDEILAQQTIQP